MPAATKTRKADTNSAATTVGWAVVDGVARLVDFAPTEMVVFSDESDWAFVGGDFRAAIDTLIASEKHQQPELPLTSDDDELVEAK